MLVSNETIMSSQVLNGTRNCFQRQTKQGQQYKNTPINMSNIDRMSIRYAISFQVINHNAHLKARFQKHCYKQLKCTELRIMTKSDA